MNEIELAEVRERVVSDRSFMRIRTLCDSVTRGYGDLPPLTYKREILGR